MIKVESIKIVELKSTKKVLVKIRCKWKIYSLFYKFDKHCNLNDCAKNIDFLMPVLFNLWYYLWINIDLNSFYLSNKIFQNIQRIEKLYNNRYNQNKKIEIKNYILLEEKKQKRIIGETAEFFSLWVDSFYTLYKTGVKNLIFITWFDIRQKDRILFNSVKHKFNKFCLKNNFNWIIVETNIREFTEKFYSWNFMFWSCLATVWLLINDYNQYYISSRMDDNIWYPWWSHKNLDRLRWNWTTEFIHFGHWVSRSNKIKFIADYSDIYDYLRVCWKNYNNKYNCWVCEKCIRTMFDFYQINKLNKFHILPKKLDIDLFNNIEITDANYLYYNHLIRSWKLEKKLLNVLANKIKEYALHNKKWKKNKNIIFIDFNWVISYKNFWHSLEEKDKVIYEKINKTLFSENIQLIRDWMLWKYTSQDICKFISKELNINYEYIYNTLINDCKNIDLSLEIKDILEKLKKYYNIILVTDNMDCFTKFTTKKNQNYFDVFDSIFNSAKEWYFKVDSYLNYIKKYDSKIELSYLIDDSIWNCEKFSKLWWNAINVKWKESVIKVLKSILKKAITRWEWQI
jgi:hypothetical protein